MWRPFAGSIVEHSLDSFIVRHEKSKSNSVYTPRSPRHQSPFHLSQDDLEQRLNLFKKLKKKVLLQRVQIKKNDEDFQSKIEKQLKYRKKISEYQLIELKRIKSLSNKKKTETQESENNFCVNTLSKKQSVTYTGVLQKEASKSIGLPPIRRRSLIN